MYTYRRQTQDAECKKSPYVRFGTSRFREHSRVRRFHHLDAHVMRDFNSAPQVGRAKDLEAQNGNVVLLCELHNHFGRAGVLRGCRTQRGG
jgi:hypothetical protein